MKSIQEQAYEYDQQMAKLVKQRKLMAAISKSFPDTEIQDLGNGLKGYVSSNVSPNTKGARPAVLLNMFNQGARFILRFAVDFGDETIYSKTFRLLSSSEVQELLNHTLPTKLGRESAAALLMPKTQAAA